MNTVTLYIAVPSGTAVSRLGELLPAGESDWLATACSTELATPPVRRQG